MSKVYITKKGDRADSMYERDVADSLFDRGIEYEQHPGQWEYSTPVKGGYCKDCDSNNVRQGRLYTPDFRLYPSGIIVEAKGKFLAPKRNQMACFLKSVRGILTVRFIFMRNNPYGMAKPRKRFTDWARINGIESAVGIEIPEEWAYEENTNEG
jgi:hypothetical protein